MQMYGQAATQPQRICTDLMDAGFFCSSHDARGEEMCAQRKWCGTMRDGVCVLHGLFLLRTRAICCALRLRPAAARPPPPLSALSSY